MPADLPPPPALTWPVQAAIVRPFTYRGSPFARGLHRGVDLAAAGGTPVRAPCSGRVAHAGATPAGRAVTLRCDGWSVTLLPLLPSVKEGRSVSAGQRVGSVDSAGRRVGRAESAGRHHGRVQAGGDHAGLHLGLRRTADPFGYVDPARALGSPTRHPPPAVPAGPPSPRPRTPAPRPAPAPSSPHTSRPPAAAAGPQIPWPAWVGVALVVLGVAVGGWRAAATVHRAWASTSRRRSSTSTRRPISGTRTR